MNVCIEIVLDKVREVSASIELIFEVQTFYLRKKLNQNIFCDSEPVLENCLIKTFSIRRLVGQMENLTSIPFVLDCIDVFF